MRIRDLILRMGLFLTIWAATAEAQVVPLAYRPVASLYSSSLDEIIMISSNPNQLHIYDPVAQSDTTVNLPQSPNSLAVSPDGYSALVGMNGQVSYINLLTATTINLSNVSLNVNNVILGTNYAWLFSGGSNYSAPVAIVPSSGTVLSSTNYGYYPTSGVLNKGGNAIYVVQNGGSLQDIDVSSGTFGTATFWPYNGGTYPSCGPLWLSPDGSRVYTGCATIVHASSDPTLDMYYLRTLAVASGTIVGLTESTAAGRLAVIPGNVTYPAPIMADNQIRLFTTDYFVPAGTLQLTPFVTNTGSYTAHGKALFYNKASTNLYVVEQADISSNLIDNFAVETIPVANPPACQPGFTTSTTSITSSGSVGTTAIAATAGCQYSAVSNASWIQIVAGGYGSGNGSLVWIARPNLGSSARSGTISLGSQVFTISQSGTPSVPPALTALSYPVTDAAYSSSLDRMVLVTSSPNELHIYDPVGQGDQIVSLPLPPFAVSVSPDGKFAAVGHDGWISYVNLQTAAIVNTYQIVSDVHHVLLAGNGYIYVFPQSEWSNIFSVNISTGAVTATSAIYDGRIPRLEPNDNYFYLGDSSWSSKWNITQGVAQLYESNPGSNITCGNYWLSQDGALCFSACGKVYLTSDAPSQDLSLAGSFEGLVSVQWAANSAQLKTTAVIPAAASTAPNDTEMQFFGDTNLSYSGTLPLPSFNIGGTSYAAHGTFSFWSGDSSRLFTIVTADSTANLVSNNAIFTVAPGQAAAGCIFKLEDASTVAPATGGLGSAFVSTAPGCVWTFSSNQPWLSVYSDSVGVGPGSAFWSASYNTTGSTRSATIYIGGQAITITQVVAIAGTSQAIAFTSVPTQTLGAAPFTISATATSGLVVTFLVTTPVVCSVSGETVTILNVGSCSIGANQQGNSIYTAAPAVTQTFTVQAPVGGNAFVAASGGPYTFPGASTAFATADFNGDGKLDIATGGGVLLGDGHGGFSLSTGPFPFKAPYASAVVSADFNGDGIPDLVIASNQTITLLLGDGAGGFSLGSSLNQSATIIVVADFNNDGKPDLALLSNGSVVIATNTGEGFALSTSYWSSAYAYSIVAGDFNGDGNMDVVTFSSYPGAMALFLGNGAGGLSIASTSTISALSNCTCMNQAVADFNGDGKLDIAVSTGQSVIALLNNGSGVFSAANPLTPGLNFSPWTGALVIGDFNGDGRPDLAISLQKNSSLWAIGIATGDGTGNFALTAAYMLTGFPPGALAAEDLNGDGRLDLVVDYDNNSSSSATVGVLLGTPALQPSVYIDAPVTNAALGGVVAIGGWAIESAGVVGPNAVSLVSVWVDGAQVGTATYGIARPDVCAAFPNRPGCPNVGWSYNLDVSALALGSHTLMIIATDSAGLSGSSQVNFTSAPPPFVDIDAPIPNATLSGLVGISGWAIENAGTVGPYAVSSVAVFVDGTQVGTGTYGIARPDVCAAFPNRLGCPNVGWSYNLNVSALIPGTHALMIVATDSAGNTGSRQVNFTAGSTPFVDIDAPAPNATLGGVVPIGGWAIENGVLVGSYAVTSVSVFVDGTQVGTATYGVARPDVCAAFPNRLGCPNVGWSYNLNVSALAPGRHTLKIVATDTAGTSGSTQVNFSSGPAPSVEIDAPVTNSELNGVVAIGGWAIENTGTFGISSVGVFVDETQVGTATYGVARPDVCAAFPNRVGCPNVGWSYNLNVSTLARGPHTLKIVATDSAGISGSSQVSFNSGASPSVEIDAPVPNSTLSGVVAIGGWVIEDTIVAGPYAISSVSVLVDGTQVGTATYGVARPDVCAVYSGRPGCPDVGWNYNLDVSALAPGIHNLEIVALDTSGNRGFRLIDFQK